MPHPMCYGTELHSEGNQSLNHMMVSDDVICLKHFPIHDIVVASCRHFYHPWCALSHFRSHQSCADVDCPAVISPAWQKSFGLREVDLLAFPTEDFDNSE